jgi:hypothetical protein
MVWEHPAYSPYRHPFLHVFNLLSVIAKLYVLLCLQLFYKNKYRAKLTVFPDMLYLGTRNK